MLLNPSSQCAIKQESSLLNFYEKSTMVLSHYYFEYVDIQETYVQNKKKGKILYYFYFESILSNEPQKYKKN